ncbi:MAG TPA: hypothetical protein VK438_15090 [Xanthobacteraceae bacterium]|nr:hypothetical protein [Xanthobacteraceae bacterium]
MAPSRAGIGNFARRGAAREARLISMLLVLSLFATTAIVLSALAVAFDAYSALPFWDQWDYLSPDAILGRSFEQHNEHFILLTKLITLIDETAFGGRNVFNFFVIYLTQALHAWLLIVLARRAGLRAYFEIVPAALVAIAMLFAVHQHENLAWGFQTQFVIVLAAATAAFLALARYAETRRPACLALSALASALAASEMANGVLVGIMSVFLALALRLSRRVVAILTALAVLLLGVFLSRYTPVAGHSDALQSLAHPLQTIAYLFTYLGGILADTLRTGPLGAIGQRLPRIPLALSCGALLCLVDAFILARMIARRANILPAIHALFAVSMFAVATAALTGIGRVSFGLEQALSSRYTTVSAVMIAATFILLLALAAPLRIGQPRTRAAAAACLLLVGLVAITQPAFIAAAEGRRNDRDLATTALLAKVRDDAALRLAFSNIDQVWRGAGDLQRQGASIYADPWSGWLGRRLDQVLPPPQSVCDGTINPPDPVSGTDGARITGSVSLSPFMVRSKVILLDGEQRVAGYAFVHTALGRIKDYRPGRRSTVALDFVGHVTQSDPAAVHAVLLDRNDHAICRIGAPG